MNFSLKILDERRGASAHPLFYSSGGSIYWEEFRNSLLNLSCKLSLRKEKQWGLFAEDSAFFTMAFLALLHSGKEIHLYSVLSGEQKGDLPLLADKAGLSEIPLSFDSDTEYVPPNTGIDEKEKSGLVLYTSGSTGKPKKIKKELFQIERELAVLGRKWGTAYENAVVGTTVAHYHFYGLLFYILLPLLHGAVIFRDRVVYPESLLNWNEPGFLKETTGQNFQRTLVSSPAFLKRLKEMPAREYGDEPCFRVFSSGGFLPPDSAKQSMAFFRNEGIYEIYGSTETGGIAWKLSPADREWTPLESVKLEILADGRGQLISSFLDDKPYLLDDAIDMSGKGFILKGRIDEVVKVEDKRISLKDLEMRILETGLACDAAALFMEGRRQYIGVALELTEEGRQQFRALGQKGLSLSFRKRLSAFFHPTVLPRKWRYLEKLPRNSMGKIRRENLLSLFSKTGGTQELVLEPEILSTFFEENRWTYNLVFPENYRYFDGHFSELKLLPAVAQIDWVIRASEIRTGHSLPLREIPRLKFKNPIYPGSEVKLIISYRKDKGQLHFEYKSPDGSSVFSGGKLYLAGPA